MATVISNVKGTNAVGPDYHYTLVMTAERTSATAAKISSTLTVWLSEHNGSTYDGSDRLHCTVSAGASKSSMHNSSDTTIRAKGTTWRVNNNSTTAGTIVNADHKKTITISSFTVTGLSKTTTSLYTHLKVLKDNGTHGEYSGYGSNLTISAWPSYKISFSANGGTGGPTSQTKWKNEDLTLTSSKPARTGYTFVNWYNSSRDVHYKSGGTVTYNGNQTLKAQWSANTYTIKYNANGGAGSMSSSTHTYDTAKALTANSFTKTGYTFKGWNTQANGKGTSYANKASVKNLTSTNGATINLYAQWEINTYAVTLNANGGTFSGGATTKSLTKTYGTNLSLTSPTRSYFTFLGWSTTKTGNVIYTNTYTANSAVTLYAIWKENNITVTLKRFTSRTDYSNFEKVIHLGETTSVLVDDIANAYEFLGWSEEATPQPLPYTTNVEDYNKTIRVETENSNKTFYGMYRDISPTLFQLSASDIVRSADDSPSSAYFTQYINDPDNFSGEDENGNRLLGYFELSGEKLQNIYPGTINFSLSPSIDINETTIKYKNNRIFFDIKGILNPNIKYTLNIYFEDNLRKPVTFNVVTKFKQKIIDIYKESSSGEFEDEFRFKVNNHSESIGYQYTPDKVSKTLDNSGAIQDIYTYDKILGRGTWYLNFSLRISSAGKTGSSAAMLKILNMTTNSVIPLEETYSSHSNLTTGTELESFHGSTIYNSKDPFKIVIGARQSNDSSAGKTINIYVTATRIL